MTEHLEVLGMMMSSSHSSSVTVVCDISPKSRINLLLIEERTQIPTEKFRGLGSTHQQLEDLSLVLPYQQQRFRLQISKNSHMRNALKQSKEWQFCHITKSLLSLCSAQGWTQGLTHARQELYHLAVSFLKQKHSNLSNDSILSVLISKLSSCLRGGTDDYQWDKACLPHDQRYLYHQSSLCQVVWNSADLDNDVRSSQEGWVRTPTQGQ